MKSEKNKILKIMNELTCFYFSIGIIEPTIKLRSIDNKTIIYIEGYYENADIKKLQRFSELVNTSTQDDYDEYYWNLAGSSNYPEYILLGSLLEYMDILYENNILKITCTRKS